MAAKWTEEQKLVLTQRGCSLLVGAAAGSGKTAVLVERIVRLITEGENPPDIDRLLVLTFTVAAASQMRDRIRTALADALEKDPGNAHLQKQMTLVHNAQITTIHSFCLEVVRSHCVLASRPGEESVLTLPEPGFRIADEGEVALLKEEVLERVLEEVVSEDRFRPFVKAYASRRDDFALGQMIMTFYEYSNSDPWPARWRRRAAMAYHVQSGPDLGEAVWIRRLSGQTLAQASGILERLRQLIQITDLPGGPAGYRKALEEDILRFEQFLAGAGAAGGAESAQAGGGAETAQADGSTEHVKAGGSAELAQAGQSMGTGTLRTANEDNDALEEYEHFRQAVLVAGTWGNIGRISKKDNVDDALKDLVSKGRKEVKEEWSAVCRRYMLSCDDTAQLLSGCYEAISALADAADLFADLFAQEKRSRGIVDFSDLEHFAMQILTEGEGEDCVPSAAAREYAHRYAYVMTDEYQDSNLVQEYILRAVSGGDKGLHNRFMVGDVKQSIYRFRLARPELFLEKDASYQRILPPETSEQEKTTTVHTETAGQEQTTMEHTETAVQGQISLEHEGEDCKIELHRNFRSRPQILGAVNMIFRQIMAPDVGGVAYDEDAALVPGGSFPDLPEDTDKDPYLPELHILTEETDPSAPAQDPAEGEDTDGEDADLSEAELSRQEREAAAAGERILQMVGQFPLRDETGSGLRPARFRDIAILLRSAKGWADSFLSVFTAMGIPAYAETGGGLLDAMEVRTVLSFLHIIDNPYQDIPLAGVLRSPIGGFSDEELAAIRIHGRKCDFYTACRSFAALPEEEGQEDGRDALRNKLGRFLKDLEMFREESALTPVYILIRRLLDHTGYENVVLAMPGGEQRRGNLEMLIEKARMFGQNTGTGLHAFLRYIRNLNESGTDTSQAPVLSENDDAVRIMTIHKSKGLEFPIVFLCGMGKKFNRVDTRSELMMHPQLGAGVRCYAPGRASVRDPLLRDVIRDELLLEGQGEELRVLYVAMTRAMEKLILMGTVKDPGKALRAWDSTARSADQVLPFRHRRKADGYLDLIMPAILRHRCADALARSYHLSGAESVPCPEVYEDGDGVQICMHGSDSIQTVRTAGSAAADAPLHLFDTDPQVVYDAQIRAQLEETGRLREMSEERTKILSQIPATLTVSRIKEAGAEETGETAARFDAAGPADGSETAAGFDAAGPADGSETVAWFDAAGPAEDSSETADGLAAAGAAGETATGLGASAQEPEEEARDTADSHRLLRGAERGDLYHDILEFLDYSLLPAPEEPVSRDALASGLKRMLESMRDCGKIQNDVLWESRADLDRLIEDLADFLTSPVGMQMRTAAQSGQLHRETSFLLGMRSDRIDPSWKADRLIQVQGRIDAWFTCADTAVIVDYKTDRVPVGMSAQQFFTSVRHYDRQLAIYQEAIERLTPYRVTQLVLYSFDKGEAVTLPADSEQYQWKRAESKQQSEE